MADYEEVLISGAVSFVFVAIVLYIFGTRLFGYRPGLGQFALLFAGFLGLAFVAQRSADISVGFTIVTIGVVIVVAEYIIPDILVTPVSEALAFLASTVGFDVSPFGEIEPISFLVIAVFFVGLMIAVRVRLTRTARFPRPIFERVLAQFLRYAEVYLQSARLVAISVVALGIIALQQFGLFFGAVGDVAAEAPFVASNIVIAISGYLSLGGELPIIATIPLFGDLNAAEFAVLSLVVMAIAAAAFYRPSGAVGQFIRRLV